MHFMRSSQKKRKKRETYFEIDRFAKHQFQNHKLICTNHFLILLQNGFMETWLDWFNTNFIAFFESIFTMLHKIKAHQETNTKDYHTHVRTRTDTHNLSHTHTHTHVLTSTYDLTHTYTTAHTYTYICTTTSAHISTHTHKHTHTLGAMC